MIKRALAYILLVFTIGCSSQFMQERPGVDIAKNVSLILAAAPDELVGQNKSQLMKIAYQASSKTVQSQLSFGENNVAVVAISPQGLPLFEIQWQSATRTFNQVKYVPLAQLEPKHMLADIQLVYWPLSLLEQNLRGAKITEHVDADKRVRNILIDDKEVISIRYSNDKIFYQHHQRNYRFEIQEL